MIVPNSPTFARSMLEIAPTIIRLFIWDVAVTVFYFLHQNHMQQFELPLALFGTSIALFIGFRDNAAYARWWEARGLWGQISNGSRTMARQCVSFFDMNEKEQAELARDLLRRQIAFVHALRCSLRGQPLEPDIAPFLNMQDLDALKSAQNVPSAILRGSAGRIAEAARRGQIDLLLWTRLDQTFADLTHAQGGTERIKKTALPMHFRSFPSIFVEVFCLILPFVIVQDLSVYTPIGSTLIGIMLVAGLQVGDDLKDPFAGNVHDVPMTSICRTIEIDLLQALGEPVPEPLAPVKGVLM